MMARKNPTSNDITIQQVAVDTNTSAATIRNWIKTGYLKQNAEGLIEKDSVEYVKQHIIGTEKLTARANKSLKDSHHHQQLTDAMLQKITQYKIHQAHDILGNEYQNALSDSYQNQQGIYYTPPAIIADMLQHISAPDSHASFLDPCCGSGNFIMGALAQGLDPANIYGFDIDPVAVAITKQRIYQATNYISDNIKQQNFLEIDSASSQKFDYIFTNPPWGNKLSKSQKELYGAKFNAGHALDSSALFFFAALQNLKQQGMLGFLLPESFFNIAVFQDARQTALNHKIIALSDYGKAFEGLLTKAQAMIVQNTARDENHQISCQIKNTCCKRTQKSFQQMPASIFNFHCHSQDIKIIEKIFATPHLTLKNQAQWGLGIVTGNNKKFLKAESEAQPNHMPIFKGADITKQGLKIPTHYLPDDLSLYQQVAPLELYQAPEKIIYKFISSNLCFYCDRQQHYILNSANMLVLNEDFPLTAHQLTQILNSEFINWLYQKIFNSPKILRANLESLPIHHGYFAEYPEFDEGDYLSYLGLRQQVDGYEIE